MVVRRGHQSPQNCVADSCEQPRVFGNGIHAYCKSSKFSELMSRPSSPTHLLMFERDSHVSQADLKLTM